MKLLRVVEGSFSLLSVLPTLALPGAARWRLIPFPGHGLIPWPGPLVQVGMAILLLPGWVKTVEDALTGVLACALMSLRQALPARQPFLPRAAFVVVGDGEKLVDRKMTRLLGVHAGQLASRTMRCA